MRGRKPLPTAIKRLNGNPGRRPLNGAEPKLPGGGLSCPKHLNDAAKREWHRVVRDLRAAGILARVDRAALEAYCVVYARWQQAELEIEEEGLTLIGPKGGVTKNPAVTVAHQAMVIMHKFMSEFGMTPSSRSRLKVEKPDVGQSLAEMLFDGVETAEEGEEND